MAVVVLGPWLLDSEAGVFVLNRRGDGGARHARGSAWWPYNAPQVPGVRGPGRNAVQEFILHARIDLRRAQPQDLDLRRRDLPQIMPQILTS
eukprot:COSAG02_NODE_2443_length_8852_cov_63.348795_6_plen_92_part_00